METNQIHRGRLIDHLQLVVSDLQRSRRFYAAVLEVLGIPITDGPGFFWADELFISTADSPAAAGKLTGRVHFALQAKDRETVERAYVAGLEAGGKDNGKPGERPYHPGYVPFHWRKWWDFGGGTLGDSAWYSSPCSSSWNDAEQMKICSPFCTATTRRAEKLPPSRLRSTL